MYSWKNIHHIHEYVQNHRVCLLLLILLDIYTEVTHNSLNTAFNLTEHLIRTAKCMLYSQNEHRILIKVKIQMNLY